MRGDYNRYLAEFQLDEDYNKALENAQTAYREADKICQMNLAATNPIRLGLHLNMSVFYYEILNNHEQAIGLAKKAFDEAIQSIDNVNQDQYKDCTLIMQLLRDNLTLWNSDV
jgi:14-3-3 protein epsilon